MTVSVAVFVSFGIAAAVLLGLGMGFDRGAYVILGLIIAFGLLAIAVTHRSEIGSVRPARCPHCDGLISSHAPHCKHCGEVLEPAP